MLEEYKKVILTCFKRNDADDKKFKCQDKRCQPDGPGKLIFPEITDCFYIYGTPIWMITSATATRRQKL